MAITICCTALSVWNVFKDRRASELSNLRSFPKASAKVMLFFDLPNFPKLFFRKNRNFSSFVTNNTRTRVQNEQIFTLRRQNYNIILLNRHKRIPQKKWKNPQKKSRFLKKISFPNHFFSRSPILLFTDQCKNIKN